MTVEVDIVFFSYLEHQHIDSSVDSLAHQSLAFSIQKKLALTLKSQKINEVWYGTKRWAFFMFNNIVVITKGFLVQSTNSKI